ncbi:MAG TPA: PepSY domain-containing protein, partial [Bryobacteraceae bacterium]|nr:PepSY domain-containing protein [Bryobacteraceae bacterium]
MKAKTVRTWYQVHKWTSLISTAFLLLLCLTGLPLVFHHEIEGMLGDEVPPPETVPAGAPKATLDLIVQEGKARCGNLFLQYMVWDPDEPNAVSLSFGPTATELVSRVLNFDRRTGAVLHEPKIKGGFLYTMLRLHTDMFAGLGGKLFMGVMGALFVVAVVSGVAVYGPFMR